MDNFDNIIEEVISEHITEMQRGERQELLAASAGATSSIAFENYIRQKRLKREHKEQENALRRVLRRKLGTEEQQKELLRPSAEKIIKEVLNEAKKRLDGMTF